MLTHAHVQCIGRRMLSCLVLVDIPELDALVQLLLPLLLLLLVVSIIVLLHVSEAESSLYHAAAIRFGILAHAAGGAQGTMRVGGQEGIHHCEGMPTKWSSWNQTATGTAANMSDASTVVQPSALHSHQQHPRMRLLLTHPSSTFPPAHTLNHAQSSQKKSFERSTFRAFFCQGEISKRSLGHDFDVIFKDSRSDKGTT